MRKMDLQWFDADTEHIVLTHPQDILYTVTLGNSEHAACLSHVCEVKDVNPHRFDIAVEDWNRLVSKTTELLGHPQSRLKDVTDDQLHIILHWRFDNKSLIADLRVTY